MNFRCHPNIRYLTILIGFLLINHCATYRTSYSSSKIIYPEWVKYLKSTPKNIAILPFAAYGTKAKSVARQFESKFRAGLIEGRTYRILERSRIDQILHEQRFQLSGLTHQSAVRVGNILGADIIILGEIPTYMEEETYNGYAEGSTRAGDEYERIVSLNIALSIISVETGEILYEHNRTYQESQIGYKNVRSIKKKKSDYGDDVLNTISDIINAVTDLDIIFSDGMGAYSGLKDKCINSAVNTCLPEFLPYRIRYKNVNSDDGSGNTTLISREEIGREFGITPKDRNIKTKPNSKTHRTNNRGKGNLTVGQPKVPTTDTNREKRIVQKRLSFATEYYKNRAYEDALINYTKALDYDPNNVDAYVGLGNVYLQQGALAEAERNFKRATVIDPKCGEAWEGLTTVLEKKGDMHGAYITHQKAKMFKK